MTKLVIRSKRVVTSDDVSAATIHVEEGRITHIDAWDAVGDGELHDYGDDAVMAGLVDSHVHVNEPGRTDWEGFVTATRAAAAGGITTIVDMPLNSIPPTTTLAGLQAKVAALPGKCQADVALWGGAVPENLDQLPALLEAGVVGFKCFLVESGVPEFGHLDPAALEQALKILAPTGAPLLVHAELPGPLAEVRPQGSTRSYEWYLQSRPAAAEDQAIALVAALTRQAGAHAHIVHLSSSTALPILATAQLDHVAITAETTPHYLHFESEQIPDGATEYKCAPPIRESVNRARLWDGLRAGVVEMVVSDHSPCTADLKRKESGEFDRAWGGISSLQLTLPIVWTNAAARGCTLADLTCWMSEAPARLAGLLGRKGMLDAGYDADLVVWSPEEKFTVRAGDLQHRNKITPYDGHELQGIVRATYLRGQKIFDSGSFADPRGEWIKGRISR